MRILEINSKTRGLRCVAAALSVLAPALAWGAAPQWSAVGPYGGDARSLAAEPGNPRHLYLGTTSSWIYNSDDGGSSWQRLAKLGAGDNLVVDNLLVDAADPKTVYAGVFQVDAHGGGVYISHDRGQHWAPVPTMEGQSVRALTQAPSNPKVLVAGAVEGVFRSDDQGEHWAKLTPGDSTELKEVESVAIDPADTDTIYAGTWHLPWKTTDGGRHWSNVKEGLIDDSDVFSIIIDPSAPSVVYASACSGIYKSLNGGALFRKVQGIPSTARRTRVLMQDPVQRQIVYAGTTEGLYKTADGGAGWSRLTGPDVIVNDVFVDPKNDRHLLLATDRSGVIESEDGGATFQSSNTGFTQRQVRTLLLDAKVPATIYAGVLNDKIYGGVFVSQDGGTKWEQRSDGLEGRDVFTLAQSGEGTVFAGTSHGIFQLANNTWQRAGELIVRTQEKVPVRATRAKRGTAASKKSKAAPVEPATREKITQGGPLDARVNQLALSGTVWYAATSGGLFRSADQGQSWEAAPLPPTDTQFVGAQGDVAIAGRRDQLVLSNDSGKTWTPIPLPGKLTTVSALVVAGNRSVWVGGREGLFYSEDSGGSWKQLANLPLSEISGLSYDEALKRVLVTSRSSNLVFGVDGTGGEWKWWDAGWKVHEVHSRNGRLVAASLYNGVVIEQEAAAGPPASAGAR